MNKRDNILEDAIAVMRVLVKTEHLSSHERIAASAELRYLVELRSQNGEDTEA